jgi:hypothetical protein
VVPGMELVVVGTLGDAVRAALAAERVPAGRQP